MTSDNMLTEVKTNVISEQIYKYAWSNRCKKANQPSKRHTILQRTYKRTTSHSTLSVVVNHFNGENI